MRCECGQWVSVEDQHQHMTEESSLFLGSTEHEWVQLRELTGPVTNVQGLTLTEIVDRL